MAWEAIGLFAVAEAQVVRFVDTYVLGVPPKLRKVVLKRLSTREQALVLSVLLDDKSLAPHYPDLVDRNTRGATTRNRLAHGQLIYVASDDLEDAEYDGPDPIREGIGILGNQGANNVPVDELSAFLRDAEDLVGLLTVLAAEVGNSKTQPIAVADGWLTLPLGGAPVKLTSPREPLRPSRWGRMR